MPRSELDIARGKLEAQLEIAKIRLNLSGYRPTKKELKVLVDATELFLKLDYEETIWRARNGG